MELKQILGLLLRYYHDYRIEVYEEAGKIVGFECPYCGGCIRIEDLEVAICPLCSEELR